MGLTIDSYCEYRKALGDVKGLLIDDRGFVSRAQMLRKTVLIGKLQSPKCALLAFLRFVKQEQPSHNGLTSIARPFAPLLETHLDG